MSQQRFSTLGSPIFCMLTQLGKEKHFFLGGEANFGACTVTLLLEHCNPIMCPQLKGMGLQWASFFSLDVHSQYLMQK